MAASKGGLIWQTFMGLNPAGISRGRKGMALAYTQMQRNYAEDKNNQIVFVTDSDSGVAVDDLVREFALMNNARNAKLKVIQLAALEPSKRPGKNTNAPEVAVSIASRRQLRKALYQLMEQSYPALLRAPQIRLTFNPSVVSSYSPIPSAYTNIDKGAGNDIYPGEYVTQYVELQLHREKAGIPSEPPNDPLVASLMQKKQLVRADISYQNIGTEQQNTEVVSLSRFKKKMDLEMLWQYAFAKTENSDHKHQQRLENLIENLSMIFAAPSETAQRDVLEGVLLEMKSAAASGSP